MSGSVSARGVTHDTSRMLTRHDERISTLHRDMEGLAATVTKLSKSVEAQWDSLNAIRTGLTELSAAYKSQPRTDFGRMATVAATTGGLVAMLVAGITYIVTGSQQPQLDLIRSDMRLLNFRMQLMERAEIKHPSNTRFRPAAELRWRST